MSAAPPAPSVPKAAPAAGVLRLIIGVAAIGVVAYAYLLAASSGDSHGDANPFNFFGYFTNQTSLVTGAALVLAGVSALRAAPTPAWLDYLRAVATTCMIIVAAIYNGLVPGTGSAPPWVSLVLHAALPAYALLDWLLAGDRRALRWRRFWVVLPYPLAWLAVVLLRGRTDGWVPYGFLLPSQGAGSLAVHALGLLVALCVAGAVVWGVSRLAGWRVLLRRAAGG